MDRKCSIARMSAPSRLRCQLDGPVRSIVVASPGVVPVDRVGSYWADPADTRRSPPAKESEYASTATCPAFFRRDREKQKPADALCCWLSEPGKRLTPRDVLR